MPTTTPGPGRGRYIVRSGDSRTLAEFINGTEADPDIELLDLIGPAGEPHTAVVEMSHERAAAFAQQFRSSNQLTIEPDRPLSMFSGM